MGLGRRVMMCVWLSGDDAAFPQAGPWPSADREPAALARWLEGRRRCLPVHRAHLPPEHRVRGLGAPSLPGSLPPCSALTSRGEWRCDQRCFRAKSPGSCEPRVSSWPRGCRQSCLALVTLRWSHGEFVRVNGSRQLGEAEGRGEVGESQGDRAAQGCLCSGHLLLERGNMVYVRVLNQETRRLLILSACRSLGPSSGCVSSSLRTLDLGTGGRGRCGGPEWT